jgi:hypothetical protein
LYLSKETDSQKEIVTLLPIRVNGFCRKAGEEVCDKFFWPFQVVILSEVACERSEHATQSKNLTLSRA